ncbi:MAG: hypothetical protein KAS16_03205 [Thermoplasmata archaeon]|nr:hypothetical protein [Thermoplasmata archaeon]
MKKDITRIMVALGVTGGLAIAVFFLPIYPCGYFDGSSYAGYGYHSLADIASEGLEWDADIVPNMSEKYLGDGPYVVQPQAWIMVLYAPIILALAFFGVELSKRDLLKLAA